MGLTRGSTGANAQEKFLPELRPGERVIALAGNPNVGKSTVFNHLTGMNQHTGNWPGKTVAGAWGRTVWNGVRYLLVDTPGAYSLSAQSAEEEVARDYICFGGADAVIVVCDAACLERNMNLLLQVMECAENVVVCVNLMDEAEKKGIRPDILELERQLGVPVVGTSALGGSGMRTLMGRLHEATETADCKKPNRVRYGEEIERGLELLEEALLPLEIPLRPRWVALKLLEGDPGLIARIGEHLGYDLLDVPSVRAALGEARREAAAVRGCVDCPRRGECPRAEAEDLRDRTVACVFARAAEIVKACVRREGGPSARQIRVDRLLTGRLAGIPLMLLLLAAIFFLTIAGANYPSALLSSGFNWLEARLRDALIWLNAPGWLVGLLAEGVFRVLAWVVAVMLPPMAIFFPLFTLLEDLGYLPRVAFNLDHCFKRCRACGKQCLTMCMGLGCNAAGVIGCRIIDSPRERLIAILTNSFMPCNGRFPMMISLLTVFFAGALGAGGAAVMLTGVIVLGVAVTFLTSRLLSATLLKGVPSSFTLELPPFRRPQIGRVIVRSVFDRTLFVLGRAAAVAAPAGLVIWLMANVQAGGATLLQHCVTALDPFGRFMGLDGAILMGFILGFPANEIVLPIILMTYAAGGTLVEAESIRALGDMLVQNGWTWLTAACTVLFSLMHWPCSTTMITIWRETRSAKWTAAAALLPAICGASLCALVANIVRLLG